MPRARAYGVHPRGRGERPTCPIYRNRCVGSSPRARGTRRSGMLLRALVRFIPAGAGNATPPAWCPARWPVHPRGRGERLDQPRPEGRQVGSSPRARGTPLRLGNRLRQLRFIPAGAGNATVSSLQTTSVAVHHRGRGERSTVTGNRVTARGSSPRARGTLPADVRREQVDRFIPAGAGNAVPAARRYTVRAVHPRGRGERPCQKNPEKSRRRFIPAGAGNAAAFLSEFKRIAVHPRGRGERGFRCLSQIAGCGSSPRARGPLRRGSKTLCAYRFIPAGAGNAVSRRSAPGRGSVHPRGRGERSFRATAR